MMAASIQSSAEVKVDAQKRCSDFFSEMMAKLAPETGRKTLVSNRLAISRFKRVSLRT
jgi:hypothetical protein